MKATVLSEMVEFNFQDGSRVARFRHCPAETPVAFEFAGLAYAVMLATPLDLEDFAIGFALSEGLVERAEDVRELDIAEVEGGFIARAGLPTGSAKKLQERLRLRLGEGSCGLCGIQSIEEVLRPLSDAPPPAVTSMDPIYKALDALAAQQELASLTGATHAAAFADTSGKIIALREDVGRHNALDKLIGYCAVNGIGLASGFVLLTARCSYELVEKTVRAGGGLLATISAPTSLAVNRAKQSRLTLITLVRRDSALISHDPQGAFS